MKGENVWLAIYFIVVLAIVWQCAPDMGDEGNLPAPYR